MSESSSVREQIPFQPTRREPIPYVYQDEYANAGKARLEGSTPYEKAKLEQEVDTFTVAQSDKIKDAIRKKITNLETDLLEQKSEGIISQESYDETIRKLNKKIEKLDIYDILVKGHNLDNFIRILEDPQYRQEAIHELDRKSYRLTKQEKIKLNLYKNPNKLEKILGLYFQSIPKNHIERYKKYLDKYRAEKVTLKGRKLLHKKFLKEARAKNLTYNRENLLFFKKDLPKVDEKELEPPKPFIKKDVTIEKLGPRGGKGLIQYVDPVNDKGRLHTIGATIDRTKVYYIEEDNDPFKVMKEIYRKVPVGVRPLEDLLPNIGTNEFSTLLDENYLLVGLDREMVKNWIKIALLEVDNALPVMESQIDWVLAHCYRSLLISVRNLATLCNDPDVVKDMYGESLDKLVAEKVRTNRIDIIQRRQARKYA